LAFAAGERKSIGSCGFAATQTLFVNRRLAAGTLSVSFSFKKPWNYLAEMPAEARGEAPSEATNSIWWCLLDEIRTFFDENPNCEF
jgi:hypothetical protein